jgi:Gpi18-like mannosyltransferase
LYENVYSLSWKLNLTYQIFPSNIIHFLEDQDTLPAFLKIPAMLSDVGIAFVVYLFVNKLLKDKKKSISLLFGSLMIFNPALIYNSAYWGQVDSVPLFFVLLSFYLLLYTKKTTLPALIFVAALISKQTSIIFIPLFALVYFKKYGLKSVFLNSFYSLVFFCLSFLPFYKTGNIFLYPFKIYLNKLQTGSGSDYVTDHAFNFWSMLTGLGKISDSANFIFMPYRLWGYLIFIALFLIVLYKLAKVKYKDKFVIMSCAIVSLSAFLFLTRMHSRYILLAIPFLLIPSLTNKKFFAVFAFVSLFNVVNMYHNWWAPRIDFLVELISRSALINTITAILIGIFVWILLIYLKDKKPGYER